MTTSAECLPPTLHYSPHLSAFYTPPGCVNNPHFVSLSSQTVLTGVIITFEKTWRTLKLLCFVWKEAGSPLKHLWNKCTVSVLASQWILSHMSQPWSFLHLFYTNSFLLTYVPTLFRSVVTAINLQKITKLVKSVFPHQTLTSYLNSFLLICVSHSEMFSHDTTANLSRLANGKTSGPHLHMVLTSVSGDRITSGQPRKRYTLWSKDWSLYDSFKKKYIL